MKERILQQLGGFAVITLSFIPALFIIRMYELVKLCLRWALQPGDIWWIIAGTAIDLLFLLSVAFVFLIPFLLVSWIHRTIGLLMYTAMLVVAACSYFFLVVFFTVTLMPVETPGYNIPPEEWITLLQGLVLTDPSGMITVCFLVAIPLFLIWRFRNANTPSGMVRMVALFSVGALFVLSSLSLSQETFSLRVDYYLAHNLLHYQLASSSPGSGGRGTADHSPSSWEGNVMDLNVDDSIHGMISNFQAKNREFIYLNPLYPFFRLDNTRNVLGQFFNLKPDKPDIVFIIAEPSSQVESRKNPAGSNTGLFIDSLISVSLCWEKMERVSGQPYGLFPAIFGSLPPSAAWMKMAGTTPDHFSLVRYLNENGYTSNFYYTGGLNKAPYEGFLRQEGIKNSGPWVFGAIDSVPHSARLDIYLTTAGQLTDEMLRNFFASYKTRPEYSNTIFILAGGPLVIFSPLLNESRQFDLAYSYFDITPTLLSLLKRPYNLNVQPVCHWLGKELEMEPATVHAVSSSSPELKMLTEYAVEGNFFIPRWALFPRNLTGEPVYSSSQVYFNGQEAQHEYIGIFATQLARDFRFLDLEVKYNMKSSPSDSLNLPPLVVEVRDPGGEQLLYSLFRVNREFTISDLGSGWKSYRLARNIDLGIIPDCRQAKMSVYLWNSRKIHVNLDALSVRIKGYYEK